MHVMALLFTGVSRLEHALDFKVSESVEKLLCLRLLVNLHFRIAACQWYWSATLSLAVVILTSTKCPFIEMLRRTPTSALAVEQI